MSHRTFALTLLVAVLTGCGVIIPTPTPTPQPTPTITPTPMPALDPTAIWVAADGLSSTILAVTISGEITRLELLLNEDQLASNITASRDGRTLAYFVWGADGAQSGIATWRLNEPNARLIVQPLQGYRIIALLIADDGSRVAYVELEEGKLPSQADWRLSTLPASGGSPKLLASLTDQPGLTPPLPIGFAQDGTLYFNSVTRQGSDSPVLQAIYKADIFGAVRLATPPTDSIIGDGWLSPDGTHLAYTTFLAAGEGTGATPNNVGRIMALAGGELATLASPNGDSITSLRWTSDSLHLILDILPPGDTDRQNQQFALSAAGGSSQWPVTAPDPARARLFTYAPFGAGVVYTLFPTAGDTDWKLWWISDITEGTGPLPISLGDIPEGNPAPAIVRAP